MKNRLGRLTCYFLNVSKLKQLVSLIKLAALLIVYNFIFRYMLKLILYISVLI